MQQKYVNLFHDIKNELLELLSDIPKDFSIEHVGGSSIPGVITKGDLDICIIIEKDLGVICDRLKETCPVHHPELWASEFAIFHFNKNNIDIDVMLVLKNSQYDTFVAFRDILKTNPQLLLEYNNLKKNILHSDKQLQRDVKAIFFRKVLQSNGYWLYE